MVRTAQRGLVVIRRSPRVSLVAQALSGSRTVARGSRARGGVTWGLDHARAAAATRPGGREWVTHAAEQTFDRVAPHRKRWCGARSSGKDSRRW